MCIKEVLNADNKSTPPTRPPGFDLVDWGWVLGVLVKKTLGDSDASDPQVVFWKTSALPSDFVPLTHDTNLTKAVTNLTTFSIRPKVDASKAESYVFRDRS